MLKSLIVLALAVVLAFLTNPSPERHREKIKDTLSQRSQLNQVLGVGALTAFVSDYRSLGVASYSEVNGKLVSVGAYGMVFVVQ